MVYNIYHSPVPCCIDSDESDDDEMLPLEDFGPNRRMKNGQWWKEYTEAFEVLKALTVTGFIITVKNWTIQEWVVTSWTILTKRTTSV